MKTKTATSLALSFLRRLGLEVRRVDRSQEALFGSSVPGSAKEIPGRDEVVAEFLRRHDFDSILDVGCGRGALFPALISAGKEVTGVDILPSEAVESGYGAGKVRYVQKDIMAFTPGEEFDAVLCSHVVEHMPDTESFLRTLFSFLRPEGAYCIIWPPPKPEVVGGHVNLFTMGHLVYNVVRLGVDCRQARMVSCKYSLALMGNHRRFELPELAHDEGDIELLAEYFPFPATQGFDGVSPPGLVEL